MGGWAPLRRFNMRTKQSIWSSDRKRISLSFRKCAAAMMRWDRTSYSLPEQKLVELAHQHLNTAAGPPSGGANRRPGGEPARRPPPAAEPQPEQAEGMREEEATREEEQEEREEQQEQEEENRALAAFGIPDDDD